MFMQRVNASNAWLSLIHRNNLGLTKGYVAAVLYPDGKSARIVSSIVATAKEAIAIKKSMDKMRDDAMNEAPIEVLVAAIHNGQLHLSYRFKLG